MSCGGSIIEFGGAGLSEQFFKAASPLQGFPGSSWALVGHGPDNAAKLLDKHGVKGATVSPSGCR